MRLNACNIIGGNSGWEEILPVWLENFQNSNHGVNEVGWKDFLVNLLLAEPEEMVVKKYSKRRRGGSGNNPYLPSDPVSMEYKVTIEPRDIANRLMKVREQLCEEWIYDLGLVQKENEELLRHYTSTLTMKRKDAAKHKYSVFEYSHDPSIMSPFRIENYKELVSMVTNIAVIKLEDEFRIAGQYYKENWLVKFMSSTGKGLEGNELLDAMINGPMIMIDPKVTGDSTNLTIIEPLRMAEGVMSYRAAAADEFIKILASVPNEHKQITCALLNKLYYSSEIEDEYI
eukprot:CAMPEP_0171480662 /NCGR_PEP_ID=MMETSP0946-20130122/6216_1 /TAXON_ID=109269 /ORGANISM="Vaucheria litorea, Strain CCMP2940" /LENGTH=285 /DNA_ID=CAMNT_0012011951 /DNA_START=248 /DNA_END=1105 /DNA_ORIENTATION=+